MRHVTIELGVERSTGRVLKSERFYGDDLHAEDGPALLYRDEVSGALLQEGYFNKGKLHRDDGPAWIERLPSGETVIETYFRQNSWHRDPAAGPAIIKRHPRKPSIVIEEAYYVDGWPCRDPKDGPWKIIRHRRTGEVTSEEYLKPEEFAATRSKRFNGRTPNYRPTIWVPTINYLIDLTSRLVTREKYTVLTGDREVRPERIEYDHRGQISKETYWTDGDGRHFADGPEEVEYYSNGRVKSLTYGEPTRSWPRHEREAVFQFDRNGLATETEFSGKWSDSERQRVSAAAMAAKDLRAGRFNHVLLSALLKAASLPAQSELIVKEVAEIQVVADKISLRPAASDATAESQPAPPAKELMAIPATSTVIKTAIPPADFTHTAKEVAASPSGRTMAQATSLLAQSVMAMQEVVSNPSPAALAQASRILLESSRMMQELAANPVASASVPAPQSPPSAEVEPAVRLAKPSATPPVAAGQKPVEPIIRPAEPQGRGGWRSFFRWPSLRRG